MDTKKYQTDIEIDVVPTFHQDAPRIAYGHDGTVINQLTLSQPCTLKFAFNLAPGTHSVFVFPQAANKSGATKKANNTFLFISTVYIISANLMR